MGSIYVIILGAGKTILWPFHIDRFGGFGDFFGGGMPSFIEPHLPVDGIGSAHIQLNIAFYVFLSIQHM